MYKRNEFEQMFRDTLCCGLELYWKSAMLLTATMSFILHASNHNYNACTCITYLRGVQLFLSDANLDDCNI